MNPIDGYYAPWASTILVGQQVIGTKDRKAMISRLLQLLTILYHASILPPSVESLLILRRAPALFTGSLLLLLLIPLAFAPIVSVPLSLRVPSVLVPFPHARRATTVQA